MKNTKNSPPPSSPSPQGRTQRSGLGFSIALVVVMVALVAAVVVGGMQLIRLGTPAIEVAALSPKAAEMTQQLAERRSQEAAQLASYGWIDKVNGIARIPIEQAIAVIAAQGLPVGIPPTEVATPTPEVSAPAVDLTNLTYYKDIQPLFEQHCGKCHGEENPEEGLTVTTYKGLMNGSLNGGVIKKGDPEASYLVEMVASGKMPKRGEPLSQTEIELIVAWIKAGAPEGEASSAPVANSTPIGATTALTESATVTPTAPATRTVDLSNVSFTNDVLPIFMAHCSECHGDDNPEEGLELTSYKKIMNGSLNGGVIKKGDPDASYLVEMIVSGKMPKRGGPLAQSDIDTIIAWIEQGAMDDTATAASNAPTATATVTETATITGTAVLTKTEITRTEITRTAQVSDTVIVTKATSTPTLTPVATPTATRAAASTITATATLTAVATIAATNIATTTETISSTTAATHTVDLANVSFANDVLPIFMAHCSKCHGDDNPEEGLELTSYKKLMNGSLNGGVIKKGDPDGSYLVKMLVEGKMPKRGGPLAQSDIDTIIAWVKQGATDN